MEDLPSGLTSTGDLPSGTVSLLFSDIEGSTRLLARLGAGYTDALEEYRHVLRQAWSQFGGTELGTEGDSFFVVFALAEAAVAAAVQAQRGLAHVAWPAGGEVRVRIGVHTGTPVRHEGGYVGLDVHRAARIASAAHGGQVVVSAATAELASRTLPDGVGLLALGFHRLKDLAVAEHIYQLTITDLPSDFPRLKSLGASSSLPRAASPLIGRDRELSELVALLKSPGIRLVTLTGPGGSGKTRLAVAAADKLGEAFPDGVYFVPLALAKRAEDVWSSLGRVLDVPVKRRALPHLFKDHAHQSILLVLDNVEQLPEADSVVEEVLARAHASAVVVTSRRPLHVEAEYERSVPPLSLPEEDAVATVASAPAVQMFVAHARRVKPSFTVDARNAVDVAEVCRRLDGLPLAMELAASRMKVLSASALLARLGSALNLAAPTANRTGRQRTLRATLAWSYDLLTPARQRSLRQLSVFAGGAELDALADVLECRSDEEVLAVVADLVDASLVQVFDGPGGEPRVTLLEIVRAYALERLAETGEYDAGRRRQADHYLRRARKAQLQMKTDQISRALNWFELEHANLEEVLRWALPTEDGPAGVPSFAETGASLCRALGEFWGRGYWAEARCWLTRAMALVEQTDRPEFAQLLIRAAKVVGMMGDYERANENAEAAVDMCRRLPAADAELVDALTTLAWTEQNRALLDTPPPSYDEAISIARRTGDDRRLYYALGALGSFEYMAGNLHRAWELHNEALAVAIECGDVRGVLVSRHNVACDLRRLGRVEQAEEQLRGLIPETVQLRYAVDVITLAEDYAAVLADLGEPAPVVRLLGAADWARDHFRVPRSRGEVAEIEPTVARVRSALSATEWQDAYDEGRSAGLEATLTNAFDASRDDQVTAGTPASPTKWQHPSTATTCG